jgi:glycosyltransferase involved in cell wall biosynthesis
MAMRDGVDLVHYLYPGGPLLPIRVPLVIGVFDTIEWQLPGYRRSGPERALLRTQLRRADRVMVPSTQVGGEVREVTGLESERITPVPLAGPSPARVQRQKRPYLLFVGGTERRKNLRAVLGAFATADLDGARLKVVGPREGGRRFEAATELELLLPAEARERVDWLGEVDTPELERLYAEATAVVFPSRAEGFGYPVLEAGAAGTPVIASRVPAISEGFEDAVLVVDPDDVAGLRSMMERMVADDGLRQRLIARGLELVRTYSWARTAELTVRVYREILADGQRVE